MIIKNKDNNQDVIDFLGDLLERDIPEDKKSLIDRELKVLSSGNKGEETSAYYLNFDFKNRKNSVLLHDIRIEHNGNVAQIDHILINRVMEIYVIESKNFTNGVAVSEEGDFSYFYNNRPYPIPSPIQQNERHIKVLDQFLTDNELLPKRLGVSLKPKYTSIILISPQSRLTKPKRGIYDCSAVMKSDKFIERFKKDLEQDDVIGDMVSLAKVISVDSLVRLAEKIVLHHKPIKIDYIAKFGLQDVQQVEEENERYQSTPSCPVCGSEMVQREAKKGKNAGNKFWGCSQFPDCRGVVARNDTDVEIEEEVEKEPTCPKCNGAMIKRTSKKGENAGKEFWGCQSFPKCRAVVSIVEDKT